MFEHDEEDLISEVEETEWARHSGVVVWGNEKRVAIAEVDTQSIT
jgi:hypothetical protein